MTVDEQLEQWVNGESIHNDERGECCPDFSCCTGEIADIEIRKRFQKACIDDDDETRMKMLGMFLGGMFQDRGINVHVVDGTDPEQTGSG